MTRGSRVPAGDSLGKGRQALFPAFPWKPFMIRTMISASSIHAIALGFPGVFRDEALWRTMAHGVLLIFMLTPGIVVGISEMRLEAGDGNLLSNSRFDKARRGFPPFFHYFSPWHVDKLWDEKRRAPV
jgi:hypothetical protein